MTDKPKDKQEFYQKMGWVHCSTCGSMFDDYDEYTQHRKDCQGVHMYDAPFDWSISE